MRSTTYLYCPIIPAFVFNYKRTRPQKHTQYFNKIKTISRLFLRGILFLLFLPFRFFLLPCFFDPFLFPPLPRLFPLGADLPSSFLLLCDCFRAHFQQFAARLQQQRPRGLRIITSRVEFGEGLFVEPRREGGVECSLEGRSEEAFGLEHCEGVRTEATEELL